MVEPQRIKPAWSGEPCFVVASGPSLTAEVAHRVRTARWIQNWRILVVNDAYRMLPMADALYACDIHWWQAHEGAASFEGEKWSSHSISDYCDDKREVASRYGLNLVRARAAPGFSTSPDCIHYGSPEHSGFQAINLAMLLGASRIVLCGFDYYGTHFFGEHPQSLRQPTGKQYQDMTRAFDDVVSSIEILNANPNSALKKFPSMNLEDAIRWHGGVYRDRTLSEPRTDRECAA